VHSVLVTRHGLHAHTASTEIPNLAVVFINKTVFTNIERERRERRGRQI